MKRCFTLLVACLAFHLHFFAQDLGRMDSNSRKSYLVKTAREVSETFGPGYAEYFEAPVLSDIQVFDENVYGDKPKMQKHFGRKYYTVTFPYDTAQVRMEFNFAARVTIWEDTGQPMDVIFGNGYGRNFFSLTYRQQTENKDSIIQVPFQKIIEPEVPYNPLEKTP